MGRARKAVYEVSSESYNYAKELVHDYSANLEYCRQYEKTHGRLLGKLKLENVYVSGGTALDDTKIQTYVDDERERHYLEEYLDRKKRMYLVAHPIKELMDEDKQMKAVAETLFIEGAAIQYTDICVDGKFISERTIAREKKRAIAFIAQYIDAYIEWEVEQCFLR